MQLLIVFGLLNYALASGVFEDKIAAHSRAVAATKLQVTRVSEAWVQFKDLMNSCAPKNVTTQKTLLDCGSRFLQLQLEMKSLKSSQDVALRAVAQLAPEFAPAATSLSATLTENAKILAIVMEAPEQLSNTYFASNSVYVQKQFERTNQDAFSQSRIHHYCAGLQSDIDSLVKISKFTLDFKLPFSTIYKQQVRMRSAIALVQAMTPVCGKTFDVAVMKGALARLNTAVTPKAFLLYKKSVCQNPASLTNLSAADCKELNSPLGSKESPDGVLRVMKTIPNSIRAIGKQKKRSGKESQIDSMPKPPQIPTQPQRNSVGTWRASIKPSPILAISPMAIKLKFSPLPPNPLARGRIFKVPKFL